MKTDALPPLVVAHLMRAFKLPLHKRQEAISRILKEAMLYFPRCFVDTIGNVPLVRELSNFEKYISTLKHQTKETLK